MEHLHAGAYGSMIEDDDNIEENQYKDTLPDGYLDHAAATKSYAYHNDGDATEYDDTNPDTPENISVLEIAEGERIMLPITLTSDEKLDWTLRFVGVARSLRKAEPYPFLSRNLLKLASLERDFLQTAKLYAKIIIDEKFLPTAQKTVKPANMGGIAGGLKYFKEGILFKFALDNVGLYGGDINAMKSAGHEMKSIVSLFKRTKPNYNVPLVGVIDYKGFRVIAISLLPINSKTMVYGSNDGGRTFHASDPVVNADMLSLGLDLNLQEHVIKDVTIRTPADIGTLSTCQIVATQKTKAMLIEVHKGTDGRYYLVDVARLWPPEPPSVKGSYLYRLLREEFVANWKDPLCSDGFSGFLLQDPNAKNINGTIREAFVHYIDVHVPIVTQKLDEQPVKGTDLESFLHTQGINLRHMGLVWRLLPAHSPWRRVVMSVIVARAAKSVLRSLMRRSIERFGLHNNDPFLRLIVSYFNLLLGTSEESASYWKNELIKTVISSYFYVSNSEEQIVGVNLRDEIDDEFVFRKMLKFFGVTLKESYWKSFSIQLIFNRPALIEDSDIDSIEPVLKRSDLGTFAVPIDTIEKAECKIKGEETDQMYKQALTTLCDRKVIMHNNKFTAFRYLCRGLVTQPVTVTLDNLDRLVELARSIWHLLETSEIDYEHNLRYFLQDLGVLYTFLLFNLKAALGLGPKLLELFTLYFPGIMFSTDKDLLTKRKVLSEDLLDDITELHGVSFMWMEIIDGLLARTKNLKRVSFGRTLEKSTVEVLANCCTNLESVRFPNSSMVEGSHLKTFLENHRSLKEYISKLNSQRADTLPYINSPSLEKLSILNAAMSLNEPSDVDKVVKWFSERKNLKNFSVRGLDVRPADLTRLVACMSEMETVAFKSRGVGCTMELIDPLFTLTNLKSLNISGNRSKLQKVTIDGMLKLEKLRVDYCESHPVVFAEILKHCPDLKYFSAKDTKFNDETCTALLNCPNLEVLRLKNTPVTSKGLQTIAQLTKLKRLMIGDRDQEFIDDTGILYLAPLFPNLEVLDLILCSKITDVSVKEIVAHGTSLIKLKLPASVTDASFTFKTHTPRLSLRHLNIFSSKVTDLGMEAIIGTYTNIKWLRAPFAITTSTFKRLHKLPLKRAFLHKLSKDVQLGLTIWGLTLNTLTESRIVIADLIEPRSHYSQPNLVGALGGCCVPIAMSADDTTRPFFTTVTQYRL